jgi:N6-L-threonylcarbamoyladenine synthase
MFIWDIDTSVAILEKHSKSAFLHFHSKITSDNRSYGGVHPLVAAVSHQTNLATLVKTALRSLPEQSSPSDLERSLVVRGHDGRTSICKKPDFVTVTRGPGIRASLMAGLDLAKGLSVAWQVPLLGVNHMQAHALTPRLVNALGAVDGAEPAKEEPEFPFLSLLVSGGHTMLVHSKSLCDHEIIANTTDIAIGDMIDKCARDILPPTYMKTAKDVMYGKLLESYVFPDKPTSYDYAPPSSFTRPRKSPAFEWTFNPPYCAPGREGSIGHAGSFSYSGIGTSVRRIIEQRPQMQDLERRVLAKTAMEVAFEHLASRVLFALKQPELKDVSTVVVSGGVASNQYLKEILRQNLNDKGYGPSRVRLVFPPPKFCTDNAAMIAWTGMEMYEAGWRTKLDALVVRKWTIDPRTAGGGILGLDGWEKVES